MQRTHNKRYCRKRRSRLKALPCGGSRQARRRTERGLVRLPDRDNRSERGRPCGRSPAAPGYLFVVYSLARRQNPDLMWRGWHTTQCERRDGRLLLNVGRSQHRNLVPRDREAHRLKSRKVCSSCTGADYHHRRDGSHQEHSLHGNPPWNRDIHTTSKLTSFNSPALHGGPQA